MNVYKVSKIISLIGFFCIIISYYLLIFEKKEASFREFLFVTCISIVYLIPSLLFNYLFFKKLSLWISKKKK